MFLELLLISYVGSVPFVFEENTKDTKKIKSLCPLCFLGFRTSKTIFSLKPYHTIPDFAAIRPLSGKNHLPDSLLDNTRLFPINRLR